MPPATKTEWAHALGVWVSAMVNLANLAHVTHLSIDQASALNLALAATIGFGQAWQHRKG